MEGVVVWVAAAPHGRPVALTLGPPLSLPLGGGGRWLAGEGTVCGVLCFSLDSRVRGNDVGLAGRDGCCGIDGVAVKFGHPLRRCAPRPLRFAKGRSWGRFAKRPYVASHSVCEREVALSLAPSGGRARGGPIVGFGGVF